MEEDTSLADTAAMAFDVYAGVSLRKLPGLHSLSSRLLMPQANRFIRAAEAASRFVGIFGNVAYYS